jgi:ankyrin repeat protein
MMFYFNQWIKRFIKTLVFIGFSHVHAGAYEDFFVAVRNDNVRAVHQLLVKGFDVNTLDPQKRSALMLAVIEPSPKVARFLVGVLGIDLERQNPAGETALMLAALRGDLELARLLIERGAEVNKPGWTALHYAATGGHEALVRLLLEQHAFVDSESPNGSTPLMLAAQYGSTAVVKLLLQEGAEPAQKNRQGLNALDFAKLGSRPDAVAVLTAALRPQASTPAQQPAAPVRPKP